MKRRGPYLLWLLFLLVVLGLGIWLSIESWQGKLPDPLPRFPDKRLSAATVPPQA